MDYQPVLVPRKPSTNQSLESRYWRQFKNPIFIKEYAAITCVHFSPSKPHRYAVTAATRVQIYAPRTQKVTKTISRFKDIARSGQIRADGKLIVAGDDSGLIQVFNINSREILRTLDLHKQPVHVTKFSALSPAQILSCSDDTTAKIWDMPSETAICTFSEHAGYVRSGQFSPINPNIVLTGSYDTTVRLFDARSGRCEMTMGAKEVNRESLPVEEVLMFPSGTLAVSSAGPILRVWDVVAGGRCRQATSNHQKTINTLAMNDRADRLLTGGMDHLVKVYDVSTFQVVHTMRYPAPVMCLAISPDDTHILCGMLDGTLSVRRRQPKPSEDQAVDSAMAEHVVRSVNQSLQTASTSLDINELRINAQTSRKLKEHDKLLKTFKYSAALDSVLTKNVPPVTTFAVIRELVHRDGLKTALSGRDDVLLEPVLRFLLKHVVDPRFGIFVVDITSVLIDMYKSILGQSPIIDNLFLRLRKKVMMEIAFQEEVQRVKGALTMLLSAAIKPNS